MELRLNSLGPAEGSTKTKKRVGRGISAGGGKTCGRGHKGQKARSGGNVRPGFEGGQLPLQKRVPTFGFRSRIGLVTAEVRTSELALVAAKGTEIVDLASLKAANIVRKNVVRARIFLSGPVKAAVVVRGVTVTKGARAAIEKAGGRVEALAEREAPAAEKAAPPAEKAAPAAEKETAAEKEASAESAEQEAPAAGNKAAAEQEASAEQEAPAEQDAPAENATDAADTTTETKQADEPAKGDED